MAEKVLENSICDSCGVDIRPQAMFCYNCGGAVSDTMVEETAVKSGSNGNGEVSGAWLKDDFSEEKEVEKVVETEETSQEITNETQEFSVTPNLENELETVNELKVETESKNKKEGIQENAKLKSAAAMRRKAKSFQAKQVEVVWEAPANSSTTKLLLVVALLTLFAVGIVYAALYLK